MKFLNRTLATVSLILCVFEAQGKPQLSADIVGNHIRTDGAKATVAYLSRMNEWDAAMEQVAKGSSKWIDIAGQLAQGSDAGTAEDLGIVLAQALPRNPAAVLRVLDQDDDAVVLGLNRVCGTPFIETTPAFNAAYERRASLALAHVRAPELAYKRDRCLARLKS